MKLVDLLGINKKGVISFVGAGGKTTTMFLLAEELHERNKTVLVTTTTKMFYPQDSSFHIVISDKISRCLESFDFQNKVNFVAKSVTGEGKVIGFSKREISSICENHFFDFVLIEADGGRQKSIKAPASYEPVVPEETDYGIGVIGLDVLGKTINDEAVHRSEIFCSVTESKMGDTINENIIARLIVKQNGLFKGVDKSVKKFVLFTKADGFKDIQSAELICNIIKKENVDILKVILRYRNEYFIL